ncbi:MAG: DEAD/DEAH box helicase family protein [Oscillochloris sp.]|nr:DEAD/DEAH box helicase family protein [Oscillochloris sp.]
MISRFSSRRTPLRSFLPDLLAGAQTYDRIAGYFRSSVLEIAGEALETMAEGVCVRMICNSDLDPLDVATARAAKQAMYREWCANLPTDISPALKRRLKRLYSFLASGRLKVKVLPDKVFGLLHGKAGVITRTDGRRIAFMGSTNESRSAWDLNYELVWSDESDDGIAWVQEEFDALWGHPAAVELAEAVVQDVERLARRVVIPDVTSWKDEHNGDPASVSVELPVYRRENGLWAHQKYFVRLAFEQHKRGGARLVLADQVGLGKTVQLALAAKLIALWSGGRVLVVAPRTLLRQWQEEIWSLLQLPSAIWNGRSWEDERGITYPEAGVAELARCPRRVGIVSSGLVTQSPDASAVLVGLAYDCVIVDEAHRARRRNLGQTHRNEPADPNNLLRFIRTLAPRTTSMLLATATPVQLDPIEAWDLLDALNLGKEHVLGTRYSRWRVAPRAGLAYVLGREALPQELADTWEWIRDPLPPTTEAPDFQLLRRSLRVADDQVWVKPDTLDMLRPPDRRRLQDVARDFFNEHNPFIRHIIRRTREALEAAIDPHTNEPYLRPVRVRLFGEHDRDAITLAGALSDAYRMAEEFCEELGKRPGLSSGILKTLLLRRVGSSITAGLRTGERLLGNQASQSDEDDVEDTAASSLQPLTTLERDKLEQFVRLLRAAGNDDPKYRVVEHMLLHGIEGTRPWRDLGCIIFSQYYDTAAWAAALLSRALPDETIALYAGATRSGIYRAGDFERLSREVIKASVTRGEIRLMFGTDAASEGLNLQKIGTLINLDLPWNPTRLEQRKGRIQRIGQVRDEVWICNLRYRDSVEDRVHQLLSDRLRAISDLFGQIPDTLEDVWIAAALRHDEEAQQIIDQVPDQHPFALRYDRIAVDPDAWETCREVLDAQSQLEPLMRGW